MVYNNERQHPKRGPERESDDAPQKPRELPGVPPSGPHWPDIAPPFGPRREDDEEPKGM